MTCPTDAVIAAFLAGDLEPPREAEVVAHLEACDACRRLVALAGGCLPTAAGEDTHALDTVPNPVKERAIAPGTEIGRYRVLLRLGAGGMGVVYAAHDPALDRKVALKLVRRAEAGEGSEGVERMQREARAMARLSHPNVVPVFDSGPFGDGVFLAMELVEGTTLGAWLREAPRSWREIVRAFADAGRGLAAAHAAGLVHRDFKPDNVLVGRDGRVRVTDFGLARAAGEAMPAPSLALEGSLGPTLTQSGVLLGTPAYMAPEQFDGAEADARTDQFAFCVALYEALFGARPFAGANIEAVAAAVRAGEVREMPRTRVPARIRRAILRGLSRRPSDRFPGMDALLAELQVDPVARARRAALGVAIAAAILAPVLALSFGKGHCAGMDERAARVWSEDERGRVEAAFRATGLPFAADALADANGVLDGWVAHWVMLRTDACVAERAQRSDAARVRAACLDDRLLELDAVTDVLAGADGDVVVRSSAVVRELRPLAGCLDPTLARAPAPADSPEVRERLRSGSERLARARALRAAGKLPEARAEAAAAVEDGRVSNHAPLLADALVTLGNVLMLAGDAQGAESALSDGVDAATAGRRDDIAASAWIALAGVVGHQQARFEEGAKLVRRAEAALERAGNHPKDRADLHVNHGTILYTQGRYTEAEKEFRAAEALYAKHLPADSPEIADVLQNLGATLDSLGDREGARREYEKAEALLTKTLGAAHPEYAKLLVNLGGLAIAEEEPVAARRHLERAEAIFREAGLGRSASAGRVLANLGMIDFHEGKLDASIERLRAALAIHEETYGPNHPEVAVVLLNLANPLAVSKRTKDAEALLDRGLAIVEEANLAADHPTRVVLTQFRIALHEEAGRTAAARALRATLPEGMR